jgi:CDP-paratose synthetase
MVRSLLREVNEIALTEGIQRRDFVYIDDVVDAFMRIIGASAGSAPEFRHYEVGSGASISVREFVETARTLCGNTATHLRFGAIPLRANEAMDVRVDTSRLRDLGWAPQWSLDAGLANTIAIERSLA